MLPLVLRGGVGGAQLGCAAFLWHCFGLQCFVCLHSPNSLTLCYILLAVAIFCLCNVLAKQAAAVEGIGVCKLSRVN